MKYLVWIGVLVAIGYGVKVGMEKYSGEASQEDAHKRMYTFLTAASGDVLDTALNNFYQKNAMDDARDKVTTYENFLVAANMRTGMSWEIVSQDQTEGKDPVFTIKVDGRTLKIRVPPDRHMELVN